MARRIAIIFLMILVLAISAGLFFVWFQTGKLTRKPSDPSYVLIVSPLNHDLLFQGDSIYIRTSAMLAHDGFGSVDLYVDGGKYVPESQLEPYFLRNTGDCSSSTSGFCGPLDISLLWIPDSAGVHDLSTCIVGQPNPSLPWKVCSEPVRVTVMNLDSTIPAAGTYHSQPGDTLNGAAQKFGLPPVLVAAANPALDPSQTLTGDTAVTIPSDPSMVQGGNSSASDRSAWGIIAVKISTDQPIEKGYCYYSFGANYWTRVPAGPGNFAYPLDGRLDLSSDFSSLTLPPDGGSLAMECWGWSGSSLIPLGSGKTTFRPTSSPTVRLQGDRFELVATLGVIPGVFVTTTKKLIVPPPQNVTATSNLEVCKKHGPMEGFESLMWAWLCASAADHGDAVLIWDWVAPIAAPPDPTASWLLPIEGYHVYMVLPGGKPELIKTIPYPDQTSLDLPFLKKMTDLPAFFVRAYAGAVESADSNHYIPGPVSSGLATVTLSPSYIHNGGNEKHKQSTSVSLLPPGATACTTALPAISLGSSQMVVGFVHYEPEGSCVKYYWEYSRAQVGFDLGAVKGPVSSAQLSYREDSTTKTARSCARSLSTVTTTTGGVGLADLASAPYAWLPSYGVPGNVFNLDVTEAVRDWMLGTPNAGFLFKGVDESLPPEDYEGFASDTCWTGYSGLKLTVTYYVK